MPQDYESVNELRLKAQELAEKHPTPEMVMINGIITLLCVIVIELGHIREAIEK